MLTLWLVVLAEWIVVVSIVVSGVSIVASGVSCVASGVSIVASSVSIDASSGSVASGVSIVASSVTIAASGVSSVASGVSSVASGVSSVASGDSIVAGVVSIVLLALAVGLVVLALRLVMLMMSLRSKKKMLGRKVSYHAPPVPRPLHSGGQRSLSSFKALLLRTGSPASTCSRLSAVERLCSSSCTSSSSSLPPAPDLALSPGSLFSASPLLFLPPSAHWGARPTYGSAPPSCSSRRFAARCPAPPLTAILEEEEEEEEEEKEEEETCPALTAQRLVDKQPDCRIHCRMGSLGRPAHLLSLPLMESSM